MYSRINSWLAVLTIGSISPCATAAEVLSLRADNWCPYNCAPNDPAAEGILVDLMRDAFSSKGYRIDYDILPWTQAVADVRTGRFNGALAVAGTDSVGLLHTVKAQMITINCAYGLATSTVKISKASDLKILKSIGVAKDYSYGAATDRVLHDPSMKSVVIPLGGDSPLQTNIRKVLDGKIDAFIEDINVMDYQISTKNLTNLKSLGCTEDRDNLWIGFTATNPKAKEWIEILDKAQTAFEGSGKMNAYYKKYGIKPR